MNEQNSEQVYEVVPPPLPLENTPEHQYVRGKMRGQVLNLCGQSILVAGLLIYMKNQLHELNTISQGYLDPMTMVRIVLEQNKVLVCLHGWMYVFPVVLIFKYLRELNQYQSK